MENYGFDIARVALLEQYGRFEEAAEIHLKEGRTVQAVRLFLKDSSSQMKKRAESSLLHGLWLHLSFRSLAGCEGKESDSLQPDTKEVKAYDSWIGDQKFTVVDTPGFGSDSTQIS